MAWLCSLEGLNEEYQNCHHPGGSKRLWCLHQGKRMKGERSSVTPCWGNIHTRSPFFLSSTTPYWVQTTTIIMITLYILQLRKKNKFSRGKAKCRNNTILAKWQIVYSWIPRAHFYSDVRLACCLPICPKIMLRGEKLHSFMLDTFNNLMVKLEGVKLYHVEIIR